MTETTLALVGAAGGAGTTRTAVELGAMGARDGRDVVVVDAAYATQGLSEYVSGRIDPDVTALVTDRQGTELSAAVHEVGDALPGTLALVPARAPFERLARAQRPGAARALEARIDEAAAAYDHVVVDTPPVASNAAVSAVTAVDRVAAVTSADGHGRDALQRLRGRLDDVGAPHHATLSTRGSVPPADVAIPAMDPAIATSPAAGTDDGEIGEAVADAFETVFETELGVEFDGEGFLETLR